MMFNTFNLNSKTLERDSKSKNNLKNNNLIINLYIGPFMPKGDAQIKITLEKFNDQFDNYVVYSKLQKQKVKN